MGVDCQITLPRNVSVRDVADVIGALLGCPKKTSKLRENDAEDEAWYCHTEGVSVIGNERLPECCSIELVGATVGPSERHLCYHFEWKGDGTRGLMPRSTALNIAMARGLADFFGGIVDYADWDDKYEDYTVPFKSQEENNPQDGDPWQAFQQRKLDVQPLTKQQIDECEQWAEYH